MLTIKHLQVTQSFGSDGISLRVIKDFPRNCILPRSNNNTSIVTGTFPETSKHTLVTPLHIKGDADDYNNYRPISLLPIFSKVLEKVVATHLVEYLEIKLLSKNQHGFRPKLCTTTALTVLSDRIYNTMENQRITLLTLCDLFEAFDSVSHNILLERLLNTTIDKFRFDGYLSERF